MSNLRIGGLSSGIDVDKIVGDLMKARRVRVDQLKQKKQQVEWQREDFRTVNNSLRTLRDKAFDMKLQGTFQVNKANSSNENAVTATAGTTAVPGSYIITVDQLARGVTKGSQNPGLDDEINTDGSVKTLSQQFGISGMVEFTLEGKLVNGQPLSRTFVIDTGSYTINTLAAEINGADLGITASYDSTSNRFFLTTTGTGSEYGIKVTDDVQSFLSDGAGAGTGTLKMLLQTGTRVSGQNAQFAFGDSSNMTSPTNKVTVNGISLDLKQGDGATSTITVSRDTDSVYNAVKSFIDQYNSTIELINKELSEERYKDYLPLTDEQREKLTDKQEEQWEEKARSGMLKGDSYLSGLGGRIRTAMGAVVSGLSPVAVGGKNVTHSSLAAIGILSGTYEEGGKLYLKNNGADLKKAIEADPAGVMKLFTQNSDDSDMKGIATRLYDEVVKSIDVIVDKAGTESTFKLSDNSVMGKKIVDFDKQIADYEDRLQQLENRYWKQFTAMEKAISKMNAQSAWLTQQFSGGTK